MTLLRTDIHEVGGKPRRRGGARPRRARALKPWPVDGISELDLSYTPPLGSPWDAVQVTAQAHMHEHHLDVQRRMLGVF
ncbi:hypothetical protein ACFYO0_15520 [Streptomyces sp. NPDC006365]|uniref:hypothetical protein n=1 Tax=Streptomyces sp. NPDC006365 TaxID=3364744 RepID=UPI0036CA3F10